MPGPVAVMFYQALVVSQCLYGGETWIIPPSGLKCLEGFHVEAARCLTGMTPQMVKGNADVLKAAGLCTVAECIAKRRVDIAKTMYRGTQDPRGV